MKNLCLLLTISSTTAFAHEVWVETDHTHGGEILKADLGYGHNLELETIPEKRLHFFREGIEVYGEKGKMQLVQKGEKNYHYESQKPIDDGSYIVTATYQPTFWSHDKDKKWEQKSPQEMPEAVYCEETRMFGKNVLNVGHDSAEKNFISKPIGHKLEITPLENPANIEVGQVFPVQVLFNGEPLAGKTLNATFKGFDKAYKNENHASEAQAFSAETDKNGMAYIIPLRQGFWKAKVVHKTAHEDLNTCQNQANYATLTFEIGHFHH